MANFYLTHTPLDSNVMNKMCSVGSCLNLLVHFHVNFFFELQWSRVPFSQSTCECNIRITAENEMLFDSSSSKQTKKKIYRKKKNPHWKWKEKREKKNSYYRKVNILSGHISLEYGKPLTIQYTNKIYMIKTALDDVNKFVPRTKVLNIINVKWPTSIVGSHNNTSGINTYVY